MDTVCPIEERRSVCIKCKSEVAVISTRDSPYCSNCFVENLEYRAKTAINSRWIPHNSRALLALSGGASSRVLMHVSHLFRNTSMKVQNHDKIRFTSFHVSTVDTSCINPDFGTVISRVRDLAASYNMNFTSIPIESALNCDNPASNLRTILQTLSDDTAEEVESFYKEDCLRRTAIAYKCNCIIYGSNGTRCASDILVDITRGRLASIFRGLNPQNGSHKTKNQLLVLKPLAGFTSKEISMYNQIKNFDAAIPKSIFFHRSKKTTGNIIKDFVLRSESVCPTASNVIVNIASRIREPSSDFFLGTCELCSEPAEANAREWIAEKCASESLNEYTEKSLSISNTQENLLLCYSCIRLLQDCGIHSSVARRRDRIDSDDSIPQLAARSELRTCFLRLKHGLNQESGSGR